MDRPMKLWEFIAAFFAMAIAFGTIIYNCGTTNGKTEIRLTAVEVKTDNTDKKVDNIQAKTDANIDKINNNLFDIKLMLQEKQDKKKMI